MYKLILTCSCVLRVEFPSTARRSEARTPENPQEDGSIVDILISLLCGIICKNEQEKKSEGKVFPEFYLQSSNGITKK